MKTKNLFFAFFIGLTGQAALAASVDLADKPLASGTSGEVKPNVMIILDDSGSMGWTHLPDHVRDLRSKVGYKSSQCNGTYYNPAITYLPPLRADGTRMPDVSFTNAPYDGYRSALGLSTTYVDLSTSFKAYDDTTSFGGGDDTAQKAYYYRYDGSLPAMSYTYNADGSVDTTTAFYKECNGTTGGKFTKIDVTTLSAAQKQNFANWYSYYRIRLYAAKAALAEALGRVSDPQKYRIGYTTHSYTGTDTNNSEFQKIDDYCAASPGCSQRTTLYDKIFKASASGGTPLRAALSKVGRIYAGKIGDDPVQYSCQQNFSILTTDGFWNSDAGYQIDGTSAIGNQDGAAPTPMWDGATTQRVETYQRYSYSLVSCSGGKKKIVQQEQRRTITTPINPPGPPTDSGWINYGSATNYSSCQSSPPPLPSPNPSDPVLLSDVTNSSGGTSNSLADVAMYYYQTDLRTPALGNCTGALVGGTSFDVCENNVPGAGNDTATHQHMTTFTLGLGIDGTLKYCENYDTAGACPDFEALKQGTKLWPDPMPAENLTRVDDLWHAAVNGRGKYFSAKNPESLAEGLSKALSGVSARLASAAAAATSNLEPVAGDNYAYVAMYTTVDWDGDIEARTIDLTSGAVSENMVWSAKAQLDAQTGSSSDSRSIYFATSGTLKPFTAANLSSYIAAKNFSPGTDNPNGALSQWGSLSAAEQAQATQAAMIAFLRGQSQHEDQDGNTYRLFRDRKHVLGDIVHGAPVYVKKPPFKYTDANYATFADNKASRQAVVYAAANDGMLHAFNADTGAELWAFVPSAVIPMLYKLADKNYATNHRFYVDGPITVGDICPSSSCNANQWKTILVGGLGKGGRAYYALDITDPASPSLLWEFTDANLGYTYGNAVITKRKGDGKWVVLVASGYNNVSPGDGKGRLYVLDAVTGSKLAEIVTDAAVTDPSKSGIAKISNWVDDAMLDNTTQHVYAGDLDGNLWRFDIQSGTATKLATLGKTAGAGTQPVTTRPELAEVKINGVATRVILIATGKYLGTSDVNSTDKMSLYAIKDDLSTTYGLIRGHPQTVVQDLTGDSGARSISYTKMNDNSVAWYMDLDVKLGERVDVDSKYQLGWWVVPANTPIPNVCNIGGSSWLYFVDPWPRATKVSTSEQVVNTGNALIVGINIVRLPSGKVVTIVTTSDARYPTYGNPPTPAVNKIRRLYWRELTR